MFEALLSITILFFLGLLLKKIFLPELCAICMSVSLTWLMGLLLHFFLPNDFNIDPLVLAILLGGSAVGFLYYWASIVPKKFFVFKLPYLLTAFFIIYTILTKRLEIDSLIFIIAVVIFFTLLFLFKDHKTKTWFKHIVECCRNW